MLGRAWAGAQKGPQDTNELAIGCEALTTTASRAPAAWAPRQSATCRTRAHARAGCGTRGPRRKTPSGDRGRRLERDDVDAARAREEPRCHARWVDGRRLIAIDVEPTRLFGTSRWRRRCPRASAEVHVGGRPPGGSVRRSRRAQTAASPSSAEDASDACVVDDDASRERLMKMSYLWHRAAQKPWSSLPGQLSARARPPLSFSALRTSTSLLRLLRHGCC